MSTSPTEKVVDVRGARVGVLEGGAGPTALVLHAAGGAGAWLPYHALLAQSFHVVAPDVPGFGRSPSAEGVEAIDDLAFLYLDLVEQLGLVEPIVLGSSFGGWLAAEIAVLAPKLVSKLVLVSAIGLRIPGEPITDLFALSPAQKVQALFHDPAAAAGLFPAEIDIDTALAFHRDEMAFARYAWSPFCCNPKLQRRLHRISAPTLVLWAGEDRVVPTTHGRRYAELIPHASFEVVTDCGHAVMLERPEEAVRAIERFVAS